MARSRTSQFGVRATPERLDLIDRYCEQYGVTRTAFFERSSEYELTRHGRDHMTMIADQIEDQYGLASVIVITGDKIVIRDAEGDHDPDGIAAGLSAGRGFVSPTPTRTIEQLCLIYRGLPGPTGGLPCSYVGSVDQALGDTANATIAPRELPRRVVLADEDGTPLDPLSL